MKIWEDAKRVMKENKVLVWIIAIGIILLILFPILRTIMVVAAMSYGLYKLDKNKRIEKWMKKYIQ